MILTCPECASRFYVGEGSIPAGGREVRCSSCSARWTARPEDLLPDEPAPLPAPRAAATAEPVADAIPEAASPDPDAPIVAPLPKAFRERAATRQKMREAAAAGAVWAGIAAGFMLLIGAVIVLRQDVARAWPRTAGAYAMIGFPVNLVGLTIENQHAQPQLQDGHAALVVSGVLRNIRDQPVAAPPLKVSLLNPAGKPLAVKFADPGGARIPPGEARRFTVNLLDPPVTASDVEIAFALDRPSRPRPAGPPPTRLSLRGADMAPAAPAPLGPVVPSAPAQDARPLPSGSPYALPKAAEPGPDPRG
jgi:predicted Zn finger-like uncharacterized protein